jgi:mycothiol synthase
VNITHASYSGGMDQHRMSALAVQGFSENLHVTDLPYRFSSWALDEPENIGLWLDEKRRLIGWAVMQVPFWAIDIVCDTAAEAKLYPQILAWAELRANQMSQSGKGLPAWYVCVFPNQIDRIRQLESAGYECQADLGENSWSKVLMKRQGFFPVKSFPPPEGFLVRSLNGKKEAGAYVDLHRSVFETKNMSLEWRLNTLKQPAYKPDLDIVVQAPDGRLVAFCVCWLNEENLVAQIEPLGCHKDFRRYGLGRVALAEGLKRLISMGAKEIYVETDDYRNTAFRLYESFDFKVFRDVLVYGKNFTKST